MSVKRMSTVWEHSQHKGSDLLLLLAIADNADDSGYCWPGIEHLAQKIRMTPQSVINITARLEESGELYVKHNRRHGNKYLVTTAMTEEQVRRGLAKFGYSAGKIDAITKVLLIKPCFSSQLKPGFSSEVKHVLEEPSYNHQGTIICADAQSRDHQPESEPSEAQPPGQADPSEQAVSAVDAAPAAVEPPDEFDAIFPANPDLKPVERQINPRDLQTEEGRIRAQALILEQRRRRLDSSYWLDLEVGCATIARYAPPVGVNRDHVLRFIYGLTRDHDVTLDTTNTGEVRFWLKETESLLRKAQGDPRILDAAVRKARQDGMNIKSPKSVAYALSDVVSKRNAGSTDGLGNISGGEGGMITRITRVEPPAGTPTFAELRRRDEEEAAAERERIARDT